LCNDQQNRMIDLDLSEPTPSAKDSAFASSPAHLSIPLDEPGKHYGHLSLPYTDNHKGPSQLVMPVCIIHGEKTHDEKIGTLVTLIAGIHGDELDGTLALHSLADELKPEKISGTIVLLPSVNTSALMTGLRTSALDGQNMDCSFPGKAQGSISERLAYEIMHRFIQRSELVVDLRSGGRQLVFDSCAAVRFSANPLRKQRAEEAMIAFGSANSVRLPESGSRSCLQGAVQALGKTYLQTELGGGAGYTIQTLDQAKTGCKNVLIHCGVLDDEFKLGSTRLLEVRDHSYYIHATRSGLFEPCAYLGHPVWKGETFAKIRDPLACGENPHLVQPQRDAILLACHHGGWVEAGELIAILGEEVQA